jgi:DNA-binding CsgD family transcriptional regulator
MNVLRDREHERSRVQRALRDLRGGRGGVLLVEGEPGVGRSRLLAEAVDEAGREGLAVCSARADELTRWTTLAPIATALGSTVWQLGGAEDTAMRLSARLVGEIEDRLRHEPLVIVLDDLQWADPITLAALQSFTAHLRERPVLWLLARRDGDGVADTGRLFDRLADAGATRLRLAALHPDAVTEFVVAAFGAAPGDDLAALAAGAAGNLSLLTELTHGLREQDAVRVRDGVARLVGARLPRRLTSAVRARLAGFSADTIGVLEVAAILGRRCRAADVAEVLGRTAADILRATREVLRSRILVGSPGGDGVDPAARDDVLCFRQDLVRLAVMETIAPSVRFALHRQIGLLLLCRGESRHEAVDHLMRGALPGDTAAVGALAEAAERELDSAPGAAATIAEKGLTLTAASQPEWAALVVTRARALLRSGDLAAAADVVGDALARPLAGAAAARLRTTSAAILVLTGRRADAVTEIDQVLAAPRAELPAPLLATAHAVRLVALAGTDRHRAAVEEILLGAGRVVDAATAVAHVALSQHRWLEGDLESCVEHARLAATCPAVALADVPVAHPGAVLAERLAQVGEFDLADAAVADALRETAGTGPGPLAMATCVASARVALLAGRTEEATTAARAGLAQAESMGVVEGRSSAHAVLAGVALYTGELSAARSHLAECADSSPDPDRAWVRLRALAAHDGARAAVERLAAEHSATGSIPLLLEPGAAGWWVRTAIEGGAAGLAAAAVRASADLAARNPAFATVAASAAHARGLFDGDPDALRLAASGHRQPWARASAAEDLAVGLSVEDPPSPDVVRALDTALAGYQSAGAVQDVARVRSRLRTAGVRRRHWTYAERPLSGWASLTDTERDVAELVATGLTNRQVAAQMFVSPHTVHAHLSRIFRKLGVTSRVELTGLRHRRLEPVPQ